MTAKEVSRRLRLPLSTVYFLASSQKLRGFRVGRSWRFPEKEIVRMERTDIPWVLVVDGDAPSRRLIVETLESHGCAVENAGDAATALQLLSQARFDVVFLDVMTCAPKQQATALIRQLQRAHPDTKVVIISTLSSLAETEGLDDGAGIALLPKPLTPDRLAACMAQYVDLRLPADTRSRDDAGLREGRG